MSCLTTAAAEWTQLLILFWWIFTKGQLSYSNCHTKDAGSSDTSLSCCHAGGERSPACITDVTIAPLFYLFVLQQAEEVHVADEIIRELSLALQRNLYVVPLVIQITAQDTHCHTADSHWGWCAVGLKQQRGAGLKSTFLPSFLFFSSFCTISSDNGVWHKERCCSILDI